jgi:hypothetical protein
LAGKEEISMRELIPMTELTDTELDVVCGGIFDFGNVVTQSNSAQNLNLTVLGLGGPTVQVISQHNTSLIGSAVFPII